jgi:CRISPR/Cas system-associated exonuclease Cas4 (RecB family)
MVRVVESSAAQLRLHDARTFVETHLAHGDVLLVGASRGAVDDFARSIAMRAGATMGLHRFSLTQLAARLAAPILAAEGLAPATPLGSEAVSARAAFEAQRAGELAYFEPVVKTPGFPRALARTLQEVRLAHIQGDRLVTLPLGGRDLAALLDRFDQQFAAASATDRALLFEAAARAVGDARVAKDPTAPVALLDVPLDSPAESEFVEALIAAHASGGVPSEPNVLVTIPFGDIASLSRLKALGFTIETIEPKGDEDLVALRRYLFATSQPPAREPRGDVQLFSAPGEGRESVEIARRILQEARAAVPFDEMAVFIRSPQRYVGLLEHALSRAGVPAWFDRGTRRPHPAGRAFVAILTCACEKLSARRFAEYLSLAQVPQLDEARHTPGFVVPVDEALPFPADAEVDGQLSLFEADHDVLADSGRDDSDEEAVVAGALRAPWKWETLIVESAVIGGDPARWHRRLAGLAKGYRLKIDEERREDPDSPRAARLERDLRNLGHLRAFALPVIDRLAAWPASATWGEWLDLFAALVPDVVRRPERVLRVLAELRPMSAVGPVSLDEARDVIADRLLTLEVDPQGYRYGRVFVGSPQQARGRTFRVVFVPGLAERMFPQRPHEDPMLLDHEMREPLAAGLVVQEDRIRTERLLLRLAVGAATQRLWLSYPRLEIAESRPRVPSFYALDVMRAVTGRIPSHEELQESAASAGGAHLAWPAPTSPSDAIDDQEHDLSVLKELIQTEPRATVRGQAHYLLQLNDALKRSVTMRWARGRSQWTPYDGLTRVTGMTRPLLDAKRLGVQPYSLSSLQRFAACPYQFLLASISRLAPFEEREALEKLDPLTRGSIFHEMQAELFRDLHARRTLPVSTGNLDEALAALEAVIARVAAAQKDELVPAIDRVWESEIADIAKDLRVWLRKLPAVTDWRPEYFEFAFGLSDLEGRDPRSRTTEAIVDGRYRLRGSVDLIEQKQGGATLRITDHKTGRDRTTWKTVIGGGALLQPVLYSLAVENVLGSPVHSGRLYYCTSAGGFTDREIPINEANRRSGIEALEIIDRAIELGFLPAAPQEHACTWCDFRPVCGPDEVRRVKHKPADKLGDLEALREKP